MTDPCEALKGQSRSRQYRSNLRKPEPRMVNVMTGDGAAIGGELTSNAKVRKITFTGSTRVGKLLYRHLQTR